MFDVLKPLEGLSLLKLCPSSPLKTHMHPFTFKCESKLAAVPLTIRKMVVLAFVLLQSAAFCQLELAQLLILFLF